MSYVILVFAAGEGLTLAVFSCSSLTMTGEVLYNGEKLTKKSKRNIGYVLQVSCKYILSCLTLSMDTLTRKWLSEIDCILSP